MSSQPPKGPPKTIADWLALPDDARIELIDGEFVEKAAPAFRHGRAQRKAAGAIGDRYDPEPGDPRGPGGWWIVTEVDIVLDGRVFRPDIAGWRRERLPVEPEDRLIATRPDWVCEIVSESNRTTDRVKKVRCYHQGGVSHYWILDQVERTLTVYRHADDGYTVLFIAEEGDRVRAEPFVDLELSVAMLLGGSDEPR